MPDVTTIDYDFVYHTGRQNQPIGLIGDPERRKLVPKDRHLKGSLNNSTTGLIIPNIPKRT